MEQLTMAKVDFGGIIKNICTEWVDASEGDYILAHAGMAIATVDAGEARQTLHDIRTLAEQLAKEDEIRR